MSAGPPRGLRLRRRLRDPRLLIGVAVTAATLALAARGIHFSTLLRDLRRADALLLIGLSVPVYVVTLWVRALRWRYLTDAVCPIARGPLFRATVVGQLANNVLPLRLGEVVRSYYLGRETQGRTASLFGTVVLERAVDAVSVLALALAIFGARGGPEAGALAVGLPLVLAVTVPLGGLVWLRLAPDQVVRFAHALLRLTGGRGAGPVERVIRHVGAGLGSLQGGRHLWWVGWHTLWLWTVLGIAPFLIAMAALGVDLGSPRRNVEAAFVTLAAVGLAVSLPSAPGFVGPYHLAARLALGRFGVSEELALALGTLAHAVFWASTTALGLLVLRLRGTRFDELADAAADADQVPSARRR